MHGLLLGIILTLSQPSAGMCNYNGPLPDAGCTPGAVAETDSQVICHRSTRTVRPPVEVTNRIKTERMLAYGVSDQTPRNYELDHLIPLELGGDPASLQNLWPQPYNGDWGAHIKDHLENELHTLVCAGQVDLATAQQAISQDWVQAYEDYVSH